MISWPAAGTFCLPDCDSAIPICDSAIQFPNFFVSTSPTTLRPIGRVPTDGNGEVLRRGGEALQVILIIHFFFQFIHNHSDSANNSE
jgi:hypothetical protein